MFSEQTVLVRKFPLINANWFFFPLQRLATPCWVKLPPEGPVNWTQFAKYLVKPSDQFTGSSQFDAQQQQLAGWTHARPSFSR